MSLFVDWIDEAPPDFGVFVSERGDDHRSLTTSPITFHTDLPLLLTDSSFSVETVLSGASVSKGCCMVSPASCHISSDGPVAPLFRYMVQFFCSFGCIGSKRENHKSYFDEVIVLLE